MAAPFPQFALSSRLTEPPAAINPPFLPSLPERITAAYFSPLNPAI